MRQTFVRGHFAVFSAVAACLFAIPSHAVVLYRSATANTAAPTGDFADAGWQWTGYFGEHATGTAIAPQYFITSNHYSGDSNETFSFLDGTGGPYTMDTSFGDHGSVQISGTDLRIWKINESFGTRYASLYTSSDGDEIGKQMLVIGRGTARGDDITLNNQWKGWSFGSFANGKPASWGTNVVSGTDTDMNVGPLIEFNFDSNGAADEATLAGGDSGGPVFVQANDGQWKLAGINYGIETHFRSDPNDSSTEVDGDLFDKSGYYLENDEHQWVAQTGPALAAASGIAANYASIAAVIPLPEPASLSLVAMTGAMLLRRRR